ncbi:MULTISPECIES: Asp-tRNA(Asn)/Glu-tRNA(Gln) amidotransferase subunit GatC [unclassified Leucobacter]|uniref:Asp-tRNA(Asn)/Glu-tRNA(Gln) amidotransferase subunit GatC n=1 Tax=unclassified Leucobacter TaxID=2621730 RepID=UPI00165EB65F|nr:MULTISPECIES: Asp-tRNA(Asn)/Glu-tRNA(Gln) amidotransferase subunit GatC [unclassified Leucobacter]MBC9928063.1 Asp-tRNA(Asn)/Glu-tRNA(Gln) amidotransferase subunit GatC [Leucobacter sp. cx-169]MBC9935474.1 Asp-tRNA(Asn)/Glu-tRNA(Gln) amidotransferase subunit GatC [Leucobacter sp. cx-87]
MPENSAASGEITVETVQHLAGLARIALTDEEVATLTSELGSIVRNIAKVSEVTTPDIPATSHPIPLSNVTRPDVIADVLTQEQALSGAPDEFDGRFRVSAILGEEQ